MEGNETGAKGNDGEVKGETLKAKGGKNPVQNDLPKATESLPKATVIENSALSSPEIIKSEIENSNFEIKEPLTTMEVHHHPKVEKKDFKEYLLEGLMIFIAVTMGFFAESLREHISDNEKGHQFGVSLVADLKTDTASINYYVTSHAVRIANYKSLLNLLEKPAPHDTAYLAKFYRASRSTLGMGSVNFTARTMAQLKNSDNFRLITNNSVANAIVDYGNGTAECDGQDRVVEKYTEDCVGAAEKMMDMKAFAKRWLPETTGNNNTIALITADHATVLEYSNAIYFKLGVENNYTLMAKDQKQRAIKLIALLQNVYDLK